MGEGACSLLVSISGGGLIVAIECYVWACVKRGGG